MSEVRRWVVLDEGGQVVNVILWDGVTPWEPPEGHTARPEEKGDPGPPAEEKPPSDVDRLAGLLVEKGILTAAEVADAATAREAEPPPKR